jgi:outer membrane protein assembly factor BamB
LWAQILVVPGHQSEADSIAVNPDSSTVYVSGTASSTDRSYVTVAYDARTGQERWHRSFRHHAAADPYTAIDPAGRVVYVGGTSLVHGQGDLVLFAYDAATGDELWRSATTRRKPRTRRGEWLWTRRATRST